jgi:hypothetical protein
MDVNGTFDSVGILMYIAWSVHFFFCQLLIAWHHVGHGIPHLPNKRYLQCQRINKLRLLKNRKVTFQSVTRCDTICDKKINIPKVNSLGMNKNPGLAWWTVKNPLQFGSSLCSVDDLVKVFKSFWRYHQTYHTPHHHCHIISYPIISHHIPSIFNPKSPFPPFTFGFPKDPQQLPGLSRPVSGVHGCDVSRRLPPLAFWWSPAPPVVMEKYAANGGFRRISADFHVFVSISWRLPSVFGSKYGTLRWLKTTCWGNETSWHWSPACKYPRMGSSNQKEVEHVSMISMIPICHQQGTYAATCKKHALTCSNTVYTLCKGVKSRKKI